MLEEWVKKDWLEKYTKQKKTGKEGKKEGKAEKNVDGRDEKGIWGKRRKMGGRKENVQRESKVETIM